jgi:glyoxylase-like metal-dependent hydrolase (beta-lactamase superfamily II)
MKNTRLEGLQVWNEFQSERAIDFNGYVWHGPAGGLLIDPMPLEAEDIETIKSRGEVRWILVTSAEHMRASAELARAFGAQVLAVSQERERFGDAAEQVDHWFANHSELPDELGAVVDIIELRGGKSPMEPALYLKPLKAIYFGDLVRSHVSGVLRLLPPEKLQDAQQVASSLTQLADLDVEAVLLGDGDSLYTGARQALNDLLAN